MSANPFMFSGEHPPVRAARLLDLEDPDSASEFLFERACQKAREEGRAEGLALARETAAARLDEAATRIDATADELRTECAQAAVQLASTMASELLRTRVRAGEHNLEAMVREALGAAAAGRSRCVVHLHPDDHASLAEVPFRSGTTLEADSGIPRGDVHVETPIGLMVRDLDDALKTMELRLREELS